MDAARTERIEALMDAGAAALLASACAFSLGHFAASAVTTAAGASLAFVAGWCGLRAVPPEDLTLFLADFEPAAPFEAPEELVLTDAGRLPVDELVLTDTDRLAQPAADELVLDDVLAKLGPDSRVVRLFDPSAMPTPGGLKARIDRHLGGENAVPDASQALHDALAELRRSLN